MLFLFKFFFCGIISSLLFPPFFLTPIGFIAFPLLYYFLTDKNYICLGSKFHFFSGLFYGLGFTLIILIWIREPFYTSDLTSKYAFISYLLIIYCSLFFALAFLILKFFENLFVKFIMLPSVFILVEIICSKLSYGFPWISYSLIHSANSFGLAMIYYLGTLGLSYLTIIIFLFPIILLNFNKYYFKILFIFNVSILLIVLLLFNIRFHYNENIFSKSIDVSIAQMNFSLNQYSNKNQLKNNYKKIINEIKSNKNNLLIFGENNYPYLIKNDYDLINIQNIKNSKTSIILGGTTKSNNNYFNSLYFIDENKIESFEKKILVPFGEFLPFRKYLEFMKFIVGSEDYSKGISDRIIKTKNDLNIIPVICYEIIFYWKLINEKNKNANLIINITNDAWFGNFSGPYQHFYLSRLRAAELNKPLIRVSNNGISAVIDNYGNIINYVPLNKANTISSNIKILKIQKNYLHYHHFIFYIIFISFLFSIFIKIKYELRKK